MSFLKWLIGRKKDHLQEQAVRLVPAARLNAVSMFVPLSGKFPFLKDAEVAAWDVSLTLAGVYVAVTGLKYLQLGHAREDTLIRTIVGSLDEWNPDLAHPYADLSQFIVSACRQGNPAARPSHFFSDMIGKWTVLNILGRSPDTDDELALVRTIGLVATGPFLNWWDDVSET